MPVWMKLSVRLPLQVHTALSKEAKASAVSLNQLIVDRLNASVGGAYVTEDQANDGAILRRLKEVEERLDALEGKTRKAKTTL
ncbi:toxin-antitoxin system HicB family antitoxin [Mesorhizobium sp. WSM2239]|uniref:Toxin-antitoxin system HicB family antitoxin n=2 Tax=unclassified Mesorhizobium TaxID=325217 RepID=A0AAU8D3Q6_9HYPH